MPPTSRPVAAVLLSGALLCASLGAGAADPDGAPARSAARTDAPSRALIEELTLATRQDRQFDEIARSVADGLVQGVETAEGPVAEGTLDAVRTAAAAAFSPERIEGAVGSRLSASLSEDDVRHIVGRARTPLWRRALDAEASHDLEEDPAAFAAFAMGLGGDDDDAERLEAAGALLDALGGAEAFAALVIDTQVAMIGGAAMADPYSHPDEVGAALAAIEGERAAITAQMDELMPLVFAWTYEDLSTKELHAIVADARSPAWRRFNAATLEGLRDAMVGGSVEFTDRIARAGRALERTSRI